MWRPIVSCCLEGLRLLLGYWRIHEDLNLCLCCEHSFLVPLSKHPTDDNYGAPGGTLVSDSA